MSLVTPPTPEALLDDYVKFRGLFFVGRIEFLSHLAVAELSWLKMTAELFSPFGV